MRTFLRHSVIALLKGHSDEEGANLVPGLSHAQIEKELNVSRQFIRR